MSALYDVRTAAFAIGADQKWTDNIISHHCPAGITRTSRGVERGIGFDAIVAIAIARLLIAELGSTRGAAIAMAEQIVAGEAGCAVTKGGVEIRVDVGAIAQSVRRRLLEAVESTSRPRRGRPPRRRPQANADF